MFIRLKARLNFHIISYKGSHTHFSSSQTVSNFRRNMGTWKSEKEKFLKMGYEEKRKHYKVKTFIRPDQVLSWKEYFQQYQQRLKQLYESSPLIEEPDSVPLVDDANNKIVTIWRGDITQLEIDAIVNAANSSLLGGGGVDGAIHRAAGPLLKEECATLNGCKTGEAKITGGYHLPAKHIIHTVGPRGEKPDLLKQCYNNSLDVLVKNNLRTIAFPCISTGIYGYPQDKAAHVALQTVRSFLDNNRSKIDKIIFTLFLPEDVEIYETLMQLYFPLGA